MITRTGSRGPQGVEHELEQQPEKLLAAIAGGDVDAFEELYDLFERPVYSVALRAVGEKQKAEEVVQDTFLKVWRGAERFDPSKGAAAGWIFTITKRTAIDLSRRELRVPVPSEMADETSVPDGVDDLWASWQVNRALSSLPQDQRQAVDLFVICGLTHAEVATKLDIPLGTVKTRIYGGLKRLRQSIAADLPSGAP